MNIITGKKNHQNKNEKNNNYLFFYNLVSWGGVEGIML